MNLDNVNNKEMLQLIRIDRPNQPINEVHSFKKSEDYGFFEVEVDKQNETVYYEGKLFVPTIRHVKTTIADSLSEFHKLFEKEQKKAFFEMLWGKNFYIFPRTTTPSAVFKTKK